MILKGKHKRHFCEAIRLRQMLDFCEGYGTIQDCTFCHKISEFELYDLRYFIETVMRGHYVEKCSLS